MQLIVALELQPDDGALAGVSGPPFGCAGTLGFHIDTRPS